jgi:hypothetical protein
MKQKKAKLASVTEDFVDCCLFNAVTLTGEMDSTPGWSAAGTNSTWTENWRW